jgi:hypothetical protein
LSVRVALRVVAAVCVGDVHGTESFKTRPGSMSESSPLESYDVFRDFQGCRRGGRGRCGAYFSITARRRSAAVRASCISAHWLDHLWTRPHGKNQKHEKAILESSFLFWWIFENWPKKNSHVGASTNGQANEPE